MHDWFEYYLSQREQFVCVNGHNSISLLVACTPQGFILEPLLFLLYINVFLNTFELTDISLTFC